MKRRTGFVANSSSSSFIVGYNKLDKNTLKEMVKPITDKIVDQMVDLLYRRITHGESPESYYHRDNEGFDEFMVDNKDLIKKFENVKIFSIESEGEPEEQILYEYEDCIMMKSEDIEMR